MRAVVFGLHKFSDYCYGRHVTIESDHKPLEPISHKLLSDRPKKTIKNDTFYTEFWLQNNIQEGQWRNYC